MKLGAFSLIQQVCPEGLLCVPGTPRLQVTAGKGSALMARASYWGWQQVGARGCHAEPRGHSGAKHKAGRAESAEWSASAGTLGGERAVRSGPACAGASGALEQRGPGSRGRGTGCFPAGSLVCSSALCSQSCCFRGHCGCWVQAHWRDLGAGLGGGRDRQGWRWVRARWAPALWGPVWAQWGIASALPGLCPLAARVHLPGLAACPRTLSSIPGGRGPPARGGGVGTSG